jgi:hypothetical protein
MAHINSNNLNVLDESTFCFVEKENIKWKPNDVLVKKYDNYINYINNVRTVSMIDPYVNQHVQKRKLNH